MNSSEQKREAGAPAPASFLSPKDRLIVALDFPEAAPALALAKDLSRTCTWMKVGLELYLAEGSRILSALRDLGFQVFLDLKLHDIPNTVAGAVRSVSRAGASLLTVHAGGGPVMLAAAMDAAHFVPDAPRILGVTVLTSMDAAQLQATGITASPQEQVLRLGKMAITAGVDGLVCSPRETSLLRQQLSGDPLLVVPGIRPAGASLDDQSRAETPADAIRHGASMLVVGRPITKAADPVAAAQAIVAEIAAAQKA